MGYIPHHCAHCKHQITDGLYWVREKVYGSGQNNTAPAFTYFHAAPAGGQESSCYEKYLQQKLLTQFHDHVA